MHAVFESHGLALTGLALAAKVTAEGKNPADYLDFQSMVRQARPISARVARSGFDEAMNQAWERKTGTSLSSLSDDGALVPLRHRRQIDEGAL